MNEELQEPLPSPPPAPPEGGPVSVTPEGGKQEEGAVKQIPVEQHQERQKEIEKIPEGVEKSLSEIDAFADRALPVYNREVFAPEGEEESTGRAKKAAGAFALSAILALGIAKADVVEAGGLNLDTLIREGARTYRDVIREEQRTRREWLREQRRLEQQRRHEEIERMRTEERINRERMRQQGATQRQGLRHGHVPMGGSGGVSGRSLHTSGSERLQWKERSPEGAPEQEISEVERKKMYLKGLHDGRNAFEMNPEFENDINYLNGYEAGMTQQQSLQGFFQHKDRQRYGSPGHQVGRPYPRYYSAPRHEQRIPTSSQELSPERIQSTLLAARQAAHNDFLRGRYDLDFHVNHLSPDLHPTFIREYQRSMESLRQGQPSSSRNGTSAETTYRVGQ